MGVEEQARKAAPLPRVDAKELAQSAPSISD